MDQITQPENALVAETTGLLIPESAIPYLNSTRKWTLFFAVLGFILIGLLGLGFILVLIASALSPMGGVMAIFAVIYAILMAIYFFPVFYLFKFSNEAKQALATREEESITKSFRYLNLHFKITGIITIVMLSLYIIIIIGLMSFGMYFTQLFNPMGGF